jgi:formate hydrogenlyase subunit 6/NADH:ubiquinone oxidoreductase subunit I
MLTTPVSLFIEVYVDGSLCIGCGTCVEQCSMGVFKMNDEVADPVNSHTCIGCFQCKNFCPNNAIQTRWVMRA